MAEGDAQLSAQLKALAEEYKAKTSEGQALVDV